MSSCEGFLLMARSLPTVTTFGERSRGASANPKGFPLAPDVTLWASTWQALPPEGAESIEGKGVEPEVEVPYTPKPPRKTEPAAREGSADPVLERALAWIRE
jgi:C-terminal processing protease CtpA/Prc